MKHSYCMLYPLRFVSREDSLGSITNFSNSVATSSVYDLANVR